MPEQRNQYSADFKAKVTLEAIKGQPTVNKIAIPYRVHPNLITNWKKLAPAQLLALFSDQRSRAAGDEEKIGRIY